MRHKRDTPTKEIFRAGAPGSEGITLEFTRNFDRSKLPPDRVEDGMNGAVISALKKSLASGNAFESVNAAEMILKNPKIRELDGIKLDAVNVIVEYAVRKKEWFRVRNLLDHEDPEIRAHANKKLEWIRDRKGHESL